MGRLSQLKAGIAPLPRLLSFADDTKAQQSRTRDRRHEWRAWYKTKRWRQLRWSILTRDLFTCGMCKAIKADTSQLVADHKVPHKGNEALFWDEANLWCLCKGCHDSAKQKEEAAARPRRWGGGA
ncbi:hypothetical protein [Microcystis phage Mae-JY02]